MIKIDENERLALCRLADALSEEILAMTDEDILREFRETGQDPELNARDMRALFERSMQYSESPQTASTPRKALEEFGGDAPYDGRASRSLDSINSLVNLMRRYPFFAEMFSEEANAPVELLATLKKASARSYLTLDELVAIASTKNARSPGADKNRREAASNTEIAVRTATMAALASSRPEQAIAPLLELKGIGVATASAILSWCKPETWAVIDQHGLSALAKFGLLAPRPKGRVPKLDEWPRFVELVWDLEQRLGWRPQKIDRWLYAFDKCQLTPEQLLGKRA